MRYGVQQYYHKPLFAQHLSSLLPSSASDSLCCLKYLCSVFVKEIEETGSLKTHFFSHLLLFPMNNMPCQDRPHGYTNTFAKPAPSTKGRLG